MFSGYKIREKRQTKNMTRAELSERTSISIRSITNWEKGTSEPSNIEDVNRLSVELGCYLDDLCEDGEELYQGYSLNDMENIHNALKEYAKKAVPTQRKALASAICQKIEAYFL